MTSQVTYEDAPSPTMHLRSRCEWRAATGHRCELEPHTLAVLHKITLDDGSVRSVGDAPPREQSLGNVAATLNRLSAVEARLDALEKRKNLDAREGKRALDDRERADMARRSAQCSQISVRDAARQHHPLDGADAQALEGALSLTERERDSALSQCAAAVQAGEALRIECDALTAQVDTLTASLHASEQSLATALRERDEAMRHLNPPAESAVHATADSATADSASPRPTCGQLPCYRSTGEGEGVCRRRNVGVRSSDSACALTFADSDADKDA